MVAGIELARTDGKNPGLPNFLQDRYFDSIQELARIGAQQI